MSVVTRHLVDRVGSDPDAKIEKIINLILKTSNIFVTNMRHDLTVDLIQVRPPLIPQIPVYSHMYSLKYRVFIVPHRTNQQ